MEPDFQMLQIPDPNKCVFGPGDAWACPRIYRFILKSENVGQTISDPLYKLIVYTLPSIWQYPFSQNGINTLVFRQNRHPRCVSSRVLGRTLLVSVRFARAWGGKGFFQKVWFLIYFRHNKSEPDLTDDCIFTVLFQFLPNRFRFNMEPHELVWKSVTAILHRMFVSVFKVSFFKI